MADINLDRFQEIATLIIGLQNDPEIENELNGWINEYSDKLRSAADAKGASEDAKRQLGAIAKGLPLLATGIQGAAKSFQGGDPLSGSAAVADVIGNMVTMITSMLSSTAGPPGALVSSILSIFSMILKIFSNQKPEKSIEQKLQNVIDTNNAKELKQSLQAIQKETSEVILEFTKHNNTGDKFAFSNIQKSLNIEAIGLRMSEASLWIKRNQDVENWEAVLAAHCYAHISLMQAITIAMNIVQDSQDIKYLTAILDGRNLMQLEFIKEIKPIAQNQGTLWTARNRSQNIDLIGGGSAIFMRNAVISQNKGWKNFHLNNTPLSFAVSQRATEIEEGVYDQSTGLFTIDNSYTFAPDKDWDRDKSTLLEHPFRKDDHASLGSGIIYGRYGSSPLKSDAKIHTLIPYNSEPRHDYLDIWAIPGLSVGEINLYTAEGNKLVFWKQGSPTHTANENTKLLFGGDILMPNGYKVGMVRVTAPEPFEDEKDVFSQDAFHAVYGACEVPADKTNIRIGNASGVVAPPYWNKKHMEICVYYREMTWKNRPIKLTGANYLVAPWPNFVGIGVDKRYFWIYKAGAIACATHTEIYECLIKGEAQPPWMIYDIPNKVGETEYAPEELSELMGSYYPTGLLDLSPCDDGTLAAVYCEKNAYWNAPVYSMTPKIDRIARTLKIEGKRKDSNNHTVPTNGWESDRSVWVSRVIKQPINCWQLLDGLERALIKLKNQTSHSKTS